MRSKEKTDKTWLEAQVSRAKKGCLRLHFDRFDKNGYFYNFKSDFFGKETHYFILRFYKDNVNVTIENYKLEIKENFESVLFTRFDFSIVEQVQASLDAS